MTNKMQLFWFIYLFRAMSSPIIRSIYCIYSFWYCPLVLLPDDIIDEMELTNEIQLFWLIHLFLISSTYFGQRLRPSSGALDCIYSIWYCPPVLLPADIIDEMELTNEIQLFWLIHLFLISSTYFGQCLRPSSGALDCIYSFWYCPPIFLPAGVMDEMEND